MIFSINNLFSDAQVVTTSAPSTNVIDLGLSGTPYDADAPVERDIGKGNPICVLVQNVADSTGTSQTCQVDIEVDDNEGFSSARVVATVNFGASVAGDQSPIVHLPNTVNERYLRLNYTTGGTTPSYTLTAGITLGVQTNQR